MKAKSNALLVVLALMTYWFGLCNASAFYDPGQQRWLNRDPIGENGSINLYECVGNNPQTTVDAFGLDPNSTQSQYPPTQLPYPVIPQPITPPSIVNSPSGCGAGNGAVSKPCSECVPGIYSPVSTYTKTCSDGGTVTCWKWKRCVAKTFSSFPKIHSVTIGTWEDRNDATSVPRKNVNNC